MENTQYVIIFFSVFEYAPLGCPPFIGFCSEPRWVFGLSPLSPPILVCLRTPNESPLQGEPCTAPLPTHRQLSHLAPALSLDVQFNADILQLLFFSDVAYAYLGRPPFIGFCCEPQWVYGFSPFVYTYFCSVSPLSENFIWEHLAQVPCLPTGVSSHLVPALS